MMSLTFVFWMFVFLFAIVGAMRGWAKEVLVTFSVILAIFIITVLESYAPFIKDILANSPKFWFRTGVIAALVFFGYQTPNFPRFAGSGRFARERLQDALLGIFLGAINGYMIWGSLWLYLSQAGYPFTAISAPDATTAAGQAAVKLLAFMPPNWLGVPAVFFAVAIAFVFVFVVFI